MIDIQVMLGKHFNGVSAFISFSYNHVYVNLMRAQAQRFWHADDKVWEIPYENISGVIDRLNRNQYTLTITKEAESAMHDVVATDTIPEDYMFKTTPFAHQIDGIKYGLSHPKFILGDEQGLGKALALDTKVYTPNGFKTIADIQVGDVVFGKNGKPTNVTAVYNHTNVEMYEITFSDTTKIQCCKDHLWEVTSNGHTEVVDTQTLYARDMRLTAVGYKAHAVDVCKPVEFAEQELIINPYLLGYLIGNGVLFNNQDSIFFKTNAFDVYQYIADNIPDNCYIKSSDNNNKLNQFVVTDDIYAVIESMNLTKTKLTTQFIPDVYKYNSIENRAEIIRGIFDSSNCSRMHTDIHFITISKQLAYDVQLICESLGCIATVSEIEVGNYCGYLVVVESSNYSMLFRFSPILNKSSYYESELVRTIIDIKKIENANAKCITVDNKDSLYLINHFIPTHNTKQMIDLACIKKQICGYKHCLVIACVNGLKYNWQEEVGVHSEESGYILGTRINRKGASYIGSNEDRLADLENIDSIKQYFIITNIETLRYSKKSQVPLKTKGPGGVTKYKTVTHYPIVDKLQELIKDGEISMIVADEIHKCKDSASQQGRALLSLNAETIVALSGTPLMNNAIDLYTPLKFIGAENHSLYAFEQHYCIHGGFGNHQIIGYKNLPELQSLLDKYMLRRLKNEVLDLPEKIYINDYVEMSKEQAKLYTDILDDLRQNIDKVKLSPNPLTMLIRLRQCTGNPDILCTNTKTNPKYNRLIELMEEIVANNKKAIVFSNWTNVLNPAYELLKKQGYNPALYTGDNKDERESEKHKFKTDESCKVICGTIGAMGTGLTLTEATTVIFLDEPWNRAMKDQAEDRAHRIGTTENLNVITIMCKDTIDEKIHSIVYRKGKMSDIIVDKEEDLFKNPQVINFLLS